MNWLTTEERTVGQTHAFMQDVLTGLASTPKYVPSKYLYDRRGSELFDEICGLAEYYLTRTETAIMRQHAHQMAAAIGPRASLIELGSGSSTKTRLLLRELNEPVAYIPLDISSDHLWQSAERLRSEFSSLLVQPHVADFTSDFDLPEIAAAEKLVFYFPGSTIGNLSLEQSTALLRRLRRLAVDGCGLLIGIDLQKSSQVIDAAYNDSRGVTAAFSKNLLTRINRELAANFDLKLFEHRARYNRTTHQVDIGLVSQAAQCVQVGDCEFFFDRGEVLHTETSRKYRINGFCRVASTAGFRLLESWTDPNRAFAVLYLES